MSDVTLMRLRQLRRRASVLLGNVINDLLPFAKEDGTFRRKPDSFSPPGDVNVTTTCSCLMALALTNNFRRFYKGDPEQPANEVFASIVNAPWMSSGLNGNNPFTTTLILRTFGFLEQEGLLGANTGKANKLDPGRGKKWELHSGINDVIGLAKTLKKHSDPASRFLWVSLLDSTRKRLEDFPVNFATDSDREKAKKKLRAVLALDLQRIMQSGWIYDKRIFNKASRKTKQELAKWPTGYRLADLNHSLLADQYPEILKPRVYSLKEIARTISGDADNFSINEYPPSAAVLYWFVDGIVRARIELPPENWTALCQWAAKEFNHERSLVVAEHDAMMDPIAMGMAACLCVRLRAISYKSELGTAKDHLAVLPSIVELERSIEELIQKQTKSGIWNKYFPLFHYQDAGSNFCFTFELLEAVLYEFGGTDAKLLDSSKFIEGLEKAVKWCEDNRQRCTESGEAYTGWNSGGYLETLKKGHPESWATAVVHMFLWELTTVISQHIQKRILEKYNARLPKKKPGRALAAKSASTLSALDNLLDIEIWLQDTPTRISHVLKERIINNYVTQSAPMLRRSPIKKPLSALLFGPPGTSKTDITKAVADDLHWPLIEITPSDFVRGTLANVYLQADEIFEDLMDLSAVVVFFDEMDALVQAREGETHLDITSQFLTTTMLPKLTRLHDQARVVFFMATNFQERFDAAIKRSGRFDLLLCMGPPMLSEKLDRLHRLFLLDEPTQETLRAGILIKKYIQRKPELEDQLALYTFGELKAFLKSIGDADSIGTSIKDIGAAEFRRRLTRYSKYVTLKLSDLVPLKKIGLRWRRLDDLYIANFTIKQLERHRQPIGNILRYLLDHKESKEQY